MRLASSFWSYSTSFLFITAWFARGRWLRKPGPASTCSSSAAGADLIPNLIETVKGYAAHEKTTLEEVVSLRNKAQAVPSGDVAGRAQAEGLLGQALGRVIALAEAYPDLKANQNFAELQASLETMEGELQMARRYYNGAARDLNVKVESFPSNLVAGQFGFAKREYFEITNEADRAVPTVKF
ncbi:LemA protein [Rhizobium pisi]